MPENQSDPEQHDPALTQGAPAEQPRPTFEAADNLTPYRQTANELIDRTKRALAENASHENAEPNLGQDIQQDRDAQDIPNVFEMSRLMSLLHEQPDIPQDQLENTVATWLFESELKQKQKNTAMQAARDAADRQLATDRHAMIATPEARAASSAADVRTIVSFMENQGRNMGPAGRNAIAAVLRDLRANPERSMDEIVNSGRAETGGSQQ